MQSQLFAMRVRTDFGASTWPGHPSAGKTVRIVGPGRLADGRLVPGYVMADVADGHGVRMMHLEDLEMLEPKKPARRGRK